MIKKLSRRQFAYFLASTAILSAVPRHGARAFNACKPKFNGSAEFFSALQNLPIIDVHCHIFNATDIPAYQFAEKVIALEQVRQDFKDRYRIEGNAFTPDQASRLYRKRKSWLDSTLETVELVTPLVSPLTKSRPIGRLLLTPEAKHELELLRAAKVSPIARLDEAEERFLRKV